MLEKRLVGLPWPSALCGPVKNTGAPSTHPRGYELGPIMMDDDDWSWVTSPLVHGLNPHFSGSATALAIVGRKLSAGIDEADHMRRRAATNTD